MIFNEVFYENRQPPNAMLFVRQAGELLCDAAYGISRSYSPTHCIGFVKKGRLKLCFEGTDYSVTSGKSIFLPHNTEYTLSADRHEPPHFIWINLRGSLADGISDALYGGECVISEFDPTGIISSLKEFLQSEKDLKNEIAELIFKAMLGIHSLKITVHPTENRQSDYELYMSNSIQNGFSVTAMAEFFHCSTDTVNRQFRKSFGITPYAYYRNMRTEIAKAMLLETELTVDDIAERLRFTDRNHFSLCFKSQVGIPPAKYRKEKRGRRNLPTGGSLI